jgi:uncharacterized membrane protein YkoI
MQFKTALPLGALALAALALTTAAPASAYTGENLAKHAKVTLQQARFIALKAHPGKITDQELESEKGGTGLRYSFDVTSADGVHEVGVDARTGKVLENKKEGPHPD